MFESLVEMKNRIGIYDDDCPRFVSKSQPTQLRISKQNLRTFPWF